MVRYLQHVLSLQREKLSKGKAKGRRIPKFPHNFPCRCCEPNLPGSQHIAGMLYLCLWKPQRDLSFSQLVYCTHICSWSYMPRQGDNHISVAWVPLWWGIMLSWFLHREANSQKSHVSLSMTFHSTMMQIRIFSMQPGCILSAHKLSDMVQYTPKTSLVWWSPKSKVLTHITVHFGCFGYSTVREEGRGHCFPPHKLIQDSDRIGMTHKPDCCQKCPSWSLKNVFVFPRNISLIKYILPTNIVSFISSDNTRTWLSWCCVSLHSFQLHFC